MLYWKLTRFILVTKLIQNDFFFHYDISVTIIFLRRDYNLIAKYSFLIEVLFVCGRLLSVEVLTSDI